ncbi:MAG: YciI family protein [Gaiellales bacterium]
MTWFAVIRERGAGWDRSRVMRRQDRWDEHAQFMEALADEGFVVLGGPLGDGEQTLLIVDAEREQEIVDRLAHDPWTPMGLLRIARVERWEVLLRGPGVISRLDAGSDRPS